MKRLVIGSRGSELALTQSNYIADCLRAAEPDLEVIIDIIKTKGDKITDVPLAKIGGKGLFTKELEVALLDKRVDLAVHSLKDLPTELPEGLMLGAIPSRECPQDALLTTNGTTLDTLPQGACVGTSSLRRQVQLLANRPDIQIKDLRGNVPTRLRKLQEGVYDVIILAAAGLRRLGLAEHITETIDPDVMLGAPGQGALGIEIRSDDPDTLSIVQKLHDPKAAAEVTAERALLEAMGGGCQVPIGALGKVEGDQLTLWACVGSADGSQVIKTRLAGTIDEAAHLGEKAAAELLAQGAAPIMAQAVSIATGAPQPLKGTRAVITRAQHQAGALAAELARHGADIFELPVIAIQAPETTPVIGAADQYDWLVFTSVNGVEMFEQALKEQGRALSDFRRVSVCAIGSATADALRKRGMTVSLMPEKFVAESLIETLTALEEGIAGKHFLLPRGQLARPVLPESLAAAEAHVDECIVYDTVPAEVTSKQLDALADFNPNVVVFTSSSTARNFHAAVPEALMDTLKADAAFISIGPITTETTEQLGMPVTIQPEQHDIPSLIEALIKHLQ